MKLSNTHILAAVFFVLVAAFVLTRMFRAPARMSNIQTGVLKVDTAAVTEIRILRNSETDSTEKVLTRTDGKWRVEQSGVNASADSYEIGRASCRERVWISVVAGGVIETVVSIGKSE